MVKLVDWSTTAASNNSASPNGFPEGMAPSGVNDGIRNIMALLKAWYEDPAWVHLHTATYASASTFTVATDVTSFYTANRRIRIIDAGGTIYGTISGSSYSAPNTTVTVTVDSGGSISSPITRVEPATLINENLPTDLQSNFVYNPQTGTTYTVVGTDLGKIITCSNASAITVTVPQASTEALSQGFWCVIEQLGAGQVTIAKEGSDNLYSPGSRLKTSAQYSKILVDLAVAGSPNTWKLSGDLTA